MKPIGVALIGAGAIALANHVPGLRYCAHEVKLVALCDSDPGALARASAQTGVRRTLADWRAVIDDPAVDAVIIATPNYTHVPIALAAVAAGKHVLCEKPLALDTAGALSMYQAAQRAGVRHMTAFTYRFVPAMRYMKHLLDRGDIGSPYHFRARRFQDWGDRSLGWRQSKKLAGTGELGDMLSHRIDYGHHLLGPMRRLVSDLRQFVPVRQGKPSDVDDWVAMLVEFDRPEHTTGVLESTKLATGRGEGHRGADDVEVNGANGTIVYSTQDPLHLRVARRGDSDLRSIDVPHDFRVWPGSRRHPDEGDPLVSFRYDQDAEFIDAIATGRECRPSLYDGVMVQAVMDAAVESVSVRCWVQLKYPKR